MWASNCSGLIGIGLGAEVRVCARARPAIAVPTCESAVQPVDDGARRMRGRKPSDPEIELGAGHACFRRWRYIGQGGARSCCSPRARRAVVPDPGSRRGDAEGTEMGAAGWPETHLRCALP